MKNGADLVVRQMNEQVHTSGHFREQIALLYPLEIEEEEVTLIRTFAHVCDSGSASLDPKHPGLDTFEAWEEMDGLIENQGFRGFFHTHPPHISDWSSTDHRTQMGLAKANGRLYLWHGVQAVGMSGSRFICTWMEHGRVFRYNYGIIKDDLRSPIIRLELPPTIEWVDGAYVLERDTEE